jgi:hypothetical protein
LISLHLNQDLQVAQDFAILWFKIYIKSNFQLAQIISTRVEDFLEFQLDAAFTKLVFLLMVYIQYQIFTRLLRLLYSWVSMAIKLLVGIAFCLVLLKLSQQFQIWDMLSF